MNAPSWIDGIPVEVWYRFLSASLMMATIGLATFLLFRCVTVRSWKLRSWLVAAVLLQGFMLVRAPLDLAVLPPERVAVPDAALAWQGLADFADDTPADQRARNSSQAAILSLDRSVDSMEVQHLFDSSRPIAWMFFAALIWATIAVGIMLIAIARYVRLLWMLRHLPIAPQPWRDEWKSITRKTKRCEMLVSESAGPLLIRRPAGYALIVPRTFWAGLRDDQRHGVMLHEAAHLHRRDVWRQLAARLIATIHWFNPLAWWALRQYESASECACDGKVLTGGPRAAASFASALVELVQWRNENSSPQTELRGIGFQSMAAPPLADRVSRLLQNNSSGEPLMKRIFLATLAIGLVAFSFFQIRLTTAQDGGQERSSRLEVMDDRVAERLEDVMSQLDTTDTTTGRLQSLMSEPSGKIAMTGYLDSLARGSREEASSEAVPRFVAHYFDRDLQGKLIVRDPDTARRWVQKSQRLADDIARMSEKMDEIAGKMDDSTEVGGLFKRLLNDPQAPVAVLVNELDGGDVVARYLSEALENLLVEQADGTFRIVDSRRPEAEEQIERFEMAVQLGQRLQRELPNLANEYSDDDEDHRQLINYMRHPLMPPIAAMQLADDADSAPMAVEKLYEHFEGVSRDTPTGLKIAEPAAWQQLNELYGRVDRAAKIFPRIQERLAEYSERLTSDDPLTQRLAEQMRHEPLAVMLASELPYADADAGEELEALLAKVLTESRGKVMIRKEHEEQVQEKVRELLQICRRVRRYTGNIEQLLEDVADQQFVEKLGESGRYLMLSEIRRYAEQHRPDPVALMREDLLAESENGRLRVRPERQEIVRELITQAERVRSEAANDDF